MSNSTDQHLVPKAGGGGGEGMLYSVCGWSVELDSFSSNEKEQLWAWEYMTEEGKHDLYIDIGEEIRSVQHAPVFDADTVKKKNVRMKTVPGKLLYRN